MLRLVKPDKPLRCAIYARVSSDLQDTENSIGRQIAACRTWAKRNGHTVVDEHIYTDEGVSGATIAGRLALRHLREFVRDHRSPPFDAVLVDDSSRLDRGGKLGLLVEDFQARNIRVIAVDRGRDLTDEDEQFFNAIDAGLNQKYLLDLARKTRSGLENKARENKWTGGRVYGYKFTRMLDGKPLPAGMRSAGTDARREYTTIEVDTGQAPIVQRIFSEYALGHGLKMITHRLNSDGIPAPGAQTARQTKHWDHGAVRAILLNRKYIGDWTYGVSRWRKKAESLLTDSERERVVHSKRYPRQRIERDAAEHVVVQRPDLRLIDDATWESVQTRFTERRPGEGRMPAFPPRAILSGLMICTCGGNIVTTTSHGKDPFYSRLGCGRRRTRGAVACGNSITFRQSEIAERLFGLMRDQLLTPKRIQRAVDAVNRRLAQRANAALSPEKRVAAEAEIGKLQKKLQRLVALIADGDDCDEVRAALRENRQGLQAAKLRLAELTRSATVKGWREWTAEDVVRRIDRFWTDLQSGDVMTGRRLLAGLLGPVSVRPLNEKWENGWRLEMNARPWAVLLPAGAFSSQVGSGGGI